MCQQQYDITFEDLNPTFMFTCEYQRTSDDQLHAHDFIEILLVRSGEGAFILDGKTYLLKKGDLLLVNPGVVHGGLVNLQNPATEFVAGFSNIHFRGMESNQILFPGHSCHLHLKEKTFLGLSRLADQMIIETRTANPGRYFMLKAYLTQMILLLYRTQTECPALDNTKFIFESTNKKYIVEQIVDYMDQHYNEKISLDQIAANMYLSPFYISRIFKSEIGDTPINYLIQLRMEKARQLLAQKENASVQAVAECVGYEDAYHFSKLFKKRYGESPTQYRNRIRH